MLNKNALDDLLKKHNAQPAGNGYIDCIVTYGNVFDFINDLSALDIAVYGLTWWCHCKDNTAGCPHGMGGPKSLYYSGWFSEMHMPPVEFESNEQAQAYLKAPKDGGILDCFVPALWLDVPDDWENTFTPRN